MRRFKTGKVYRADKVDKKRRKYQDIGRV